MLWLFSPLQTWIIFSGLVLLGATIALMIWPVLPVDGPARSIYWLHDVVISPVFGRVFLRYSPYPEIIAAIVVSLGILGLIARSRAAEVHRSLLYWSLGNPAALKLLGWWSRRRKTDSFLFALAERRHRETFSNWIGQRSEQTASTAVKAAGIAQKLLLQSAAETRPADLALARISARVYLLELESDKNRHTVLLPVSSLRKEGQEFTRALGELLDEETSAERGGKLLESLWKRGMSRPTDERPEYWETVTWLALAHGKRHQDFYQLHKFLFELVKIGFDQDMRNTPGHALDLHFQIDPLIWENLGAIQPALGLGPGSEQMALLRKYLTGSETP